MDREQGLQSKLTPTEVEEQKAIAAWNRDRLAAGIPQGNGLQMIVETRFHQRVANRQYIDAYFAAIQKA